MKKCPYCAESIQDEAVFCRHCRRPLPAEAAAPVSDPLALVTPISPESDLMTGIEKKRNKTRVWLIVLTVWTGVMILFSLITPKFVENESLSAVPRYLKLGIVGYFGVITGLGLGWFLYIKKRYGWSFWLSFLLALGFPMMKLVPLLIFLIPLLIFAFE